jgi:four helix bundle protein
VLRNLGGFGELLAGIGSAEFRRMAGFRRHEDSDVYQLADAAREHVLRVVKQPAFARHFKLVEQILKSSNSACANMAEGFSRYLPGDHARFLRIAKASLSETIEHIKDARLRGVVSGEDEKTIASLCRRSRGACIGLIRYLDGLEGPPGGA